MFLSVLAYVNILLMSKSLVMFAMSQDRVFPKIFSYRHPKTEALGGRSRYIFNHHDHCYFFW